MLQVAPDVWMLSGFLPRFFNAFLVGDVLIDALTRWARPRLLEHLHGRPLSAVTLTHCHPDHQGTAKFVCERFGVPLACHADDVPMMEGRRPMEPSNWIGRWVDRLWSGPPCTVDRVLHDGDEIGGMRVIHTPGHTPGHVIYFRPSDRVAIVGDLLHNINMYTGRVELAETPAYFSVDPAENRRSLMRLLDLQPEVVLFSHGPPLRKPEVLEKFLRNLPGEGRSRSFEGSRIRSGRTASIKIGL